MSKELDAALNVIRPVLQRDGGDIQLVEFTEDGVVRVRLEGHCKGCPHARETLRSVVERTILKLVPSARRVETVE